MLRPALMALFLAATIQAQPTGWLALVEQAVEADDYADYKQAEALFKQACEEAQSFDSTEHQAEACMGLADVYAVAGDFGKARKTLDALIERLEAAPDAHAYSYAQALLESANVEMALARFDEGVASLRRIEQPMAGLNAPQAAQILAGMAEFYLPIDKQAVGGNLLRGSIKTLRDGWNPDDRRYAEAAVRVARVARWYDRSWESVKLMEPVVAAGRKRIRLEGGPLDRQSMLAYSAAASEQWAELAERWRRMGESGWPTSPQATANRVGGMVSAPALIRKKDPSYTLGAKRARAAGTVLLAVEVWPDGRAHNIGVIRPLSYGLAWEAIGAVRKWRFSPGVKGGQPVKTFATIEVNFRLLQR